MAVNPTVNTQEEIHGAIVCLFWHTKYVDIFETFNQVKRSHESFPVLIKGFPGVKEIEIEMFFDKLVFYSLYLTKKHNLVFKFVNKGPTPLEHVRYYADGIVLAQSGPVSILIKLKRFFK